MRESTSIAVAGSSLLVLMLVGFDGGQGVYRVPLGAMLALITAMLCVKAVRLRIAGN